VLSKRELQVYGRSAKPPAIPSIADHGNLYGFTDAELEGAPEMVRRALSTRTADAEQLRRFRKEQILRRLGNSAADSGNSKVQGAWRAPARRPDGVSSSLPPPSPLPAVAMMTDSINRLSTHQGANKHDKAVSRSLQILSSRRRRLLQYMQRTDFEAYAMVLKELGLRPVPLYTSRHTPKVRAETHKQINERNSRLKKRTSRGDRGH
jgi:small subunit ribosomal protein S15